MMLRRLVIGLLFVGLGCVAQPASEAVPAPLPAADGQPPREDAGPVRPELQERADRLVRLALEEGQAYGILRRLVETAPHRLAGSSGAERAVEWGVEEMQRLGLERVRRETCMVPRWIRGPLERLTTTDGEQQFAITALGGSIGTAEGGITGEVLMVRRVEDLATLGEAAQGKIVFFNRPMNPALLNTFAAYGGAVDQRSSGPIEAAKAGAVAVIVRSMTTLINDYPHTGATNYHDDVTKIPAAAISTAGAERLATMLGSGAVRLRLELSCRTEPDVESANVVGDLRGTDRADEIVLIGGHLDCWDLGQGAHDDGAGIAHCLAAIDLIQRAGLRPRRTIRVVLYMNEENGIRGAKAYVEQHRHELDKHRYAIESDRGGLDPRGFTSSARGARLEAVKSLADPLRPHGMGVVIPGGGGVDISFLGKTGTELYGLMPSSQRYFDFHHSDLDRIEAVNSRELELGAAAMAYMASVLADED